MILALPAAICLTSSPVTRARSSGPLRLFHSVCQNPCAVRLLKMNTEGGKITASLAIAPYVTKWASFPARRSIRVVDFPPTQFNSSRISYKGHRCMKSRSDVNAYLATSPTLHSFGDRLIFEIIICDNVGCSQALEVLFDIGKVFPTEVWIGRGFWDQSWETHLFRMRLMVFSPRSLASVITACPTCAG